MQTFPHFVLRAGDFFRKCKLNVICIFYGIFVAYADPFEKRSAFMCSGKFSLFACMDPCTDIIATYLVTTHICFCSCKNSYNFSLCLWVRYSSAAHEPGHCWSGTDTQWDNSNDFGRPRLLFDRADTLAYFNWIWIFVKKIALERKNNWIVKTNASERWLTKRTDEQSSDGISCLLLRDTRCKLQKVWQ